MFEADELCNRIGVIAHGELVALGTPAELKAMVSSGSVLEVEVFGAGESAIDAVRAVRGIRSVSLEERGQAQLLVAQLEPGIDVTGAVLGVLADTPTGRVTQREPSLEDAYIQLVGNA
jgi:ABC-2 type transport system ATP-binding protein